MENPFPPGSAPDPKLYRAQLGSGPFPGTDLGDDDPWNHAPVNVLEAYLNAKQEGDESLRFLIEMVEVVSGKQHEFPAILNWMPSAGVAGLFWCDLTWWWLSAKTPLIAVASWNREIGGR